MNSNGLEYLQQMKQFLFSIIFLSTSLLYFSCDSTEPSIILEGQDKWQLISGLENKDVRYIIELNEELYLSANDPSKNDAEEGRGLVYHSVNGIDWKIIKRFKSIVGAMATNNDSLYILLADSIYIYNKQNGWMPKFKTPPRLADPDAVGDIIFYNGNLYGMQTFYVNASETWCIYPDGSFEEKKVYPLYPRSYSGAKFCKVFENGLEKIYVRPHWSVGSFFYFDGDKFHVRTDGLTEEEINFREAPANSMCVYGNQLYAGFLNNATVKTLMNETWVTITDSLPNSESAYLVNPPLKTQTTGIAFINDRLFVSTLTIGVLEWTDSTWIRLTTEGLPKGSLNNLPDLYVPIPIFHSFKNKLIVAYGKPGYAPYPNNVYGVYFKTIK
jgi:hypothetical protein